jgi:hypothetical protein
VPIVTRPSGWCLGGGLEVAMACDLRLAGRSARFGILEVKVGIPSVIHAVLMPRLIGAARAQWMLMQGGAYRRRHSGVLGGWCARSWTMACWTRPSPPWPGNWPNSAPPSCASAFATGEPHRYMQAFMQRCARSSR